MADEVDWDAAAKRFWGLPQEDQLKLIDGGGFSPSEASEIMKRKPAEGTSTAAYDLPIPSEDLQRTSVLSQRQSTSGPQSEHRFELQAPQRQEAIMRASTDEEVTKNMELSKEWRRKHGSGLPFNMQSTANFFGEGPAALPVRQMIEAGKKGLEASTIPFQFIKDISAGPISDIASTLMLKPTLQGTAGVPVKLTSDIVRSMLPEQVTEGGPIDIPKAPPSVIQRLKEGGEGSATLPEKIGDVVGESISTVPQVLEAFANPRAAFSTIKQAPQEFKALWEATKATTVAKVLRGEAAAAPSLEKIPQMVDKAMRGEMVQSSQAAKAAAEPLSEARIIEIFKNLGYEPNEEEAKILKEGIEAKLQGPPKVVGGRPEVKTYLNKYQSDIALTRLTGLMSRNAFEKEVSNPDLQYAILRHLDDPSAGFANQLTAKELRAADLMKQAYEAGGKAGLEEGTLQTMRENYVNRIYDWSDIPEEERQRYLNHISNANTFSPFGKKRSIGSIGEAIAPKDMGGFGLKLKVTNPGEGLQIWLESQGQAAASKRLINNLKLLQDVQSGNDMLMRTDLAPEEYIRMRHPLLAKAMYKVAEEGAPIHTLGQLNPENPEHVQMLNSYLDSIQQTKLVMMKDVAVHPSIASDLGYFFRTGDTGTLMGVAQHANAVVKRSSFFGSLLHLWNIGEGGAGVGGAKFLANPMKYASEGIEMMQEGRLAARMALGPGKIIANVPLDSSAIEKGLVVELMDPVIQSMKGRTGLDYLGKTLEAAGKVQNVYDRGMWDYAWTGVKIHAFNDVYEREIGRAMSKLGRALTVDEQHTLAGTVGRIVNEGVGGLNWRDYNEGLAKKLGLFTPEGQQHMRIWMKAADWTVSKITMGTDALTPWRDPVRARLAATTLAKAGTATYGITVLANQLFSGHPPWQNEEGHKMDIQLPGKDNNGRYRYVHIGSLIRELYKWGTEPVKTARGKLGFLPAEAFDQLSGEKYMGGPQMVKKDATALDALKARVFHAGESFAPIPSQPVFDKRSQGEIPKDLLASILGFPILRGTKPKEESLPKLKKY